MKSKANKRQMVWQWSFLICAICVSIDSVAGGNEFLDMSLEELVDYRIMSMSRKEQRVADMAAAAYVITAEEIRRSGAQSIPEALRLVPGLNVAQISSNRWAVSSRGFNDRFSNKLLVQVDGRSIYSPMFSGVLWETQNLVMEDIERIEVIRGPGAALWGTNAMNGVINIVTRSAVASQGTVVSMAAGTGSLATASLIHGGELAQGGHYKMFGKSSNIGSSPERVTGMLGSDADRQFRLGVKVEPLIDSGDLSLKAEVYRQRSHDVYAMPAVQGFSDPATPYLRDSVLAADNQGLALQARYVWKNQEGAENALQAHIDYDSSNNSGIWGSGTKPGQVLGEAPSWQTIGGRKTDIDVDFQQRRIGGSHDFIWGLSLRHTSDDLLFTTLPYLLLDGKNQRLNYSAFVHDEINLVPERWKLIVGSKFERDGLTGFNVQPNVRGLYTPQAGETYWGGLSRSMRSSRRIESLSTLETSAQDAAEVIPNIPPRILTAVTRISPLNNAAPKAEEALSLEAGWRKQFSNFLSVDASVFMTAYSQLRGSRIKIDPVTGLPETTGAQDAISCAMVNLGYCYFTINGYNTNLEKARAVGGEFSVEWHPKAWWKVQAAYSYVRIRGVRTGDPLGDAQVTIFENSTPHRQFFLHNNLSLANNLNLDVRLRYNSETRYLTGNASEGLVRLLPYTGLDIRLGWAVNRNTELSLLGRNLLKDRHAEFINSLPMGRAYEIQRSVLLQAVVRF